MTFQINDLATAKEIMRTCCADWPQMKFQFACCYAITEMLEDDVLFDKVRRRTFKKQLDDHCLYDFWLRILNGKDEWRRILRPDRLFPDQCLLQVFRFAIVNGFFELVHFLWDRLTVGQQESIGYKIANIAIIECFRLF
jgi:hypothetical protein